MNMKTKRLRLCIGAGASGTIRRPLRRWLVVLVGIVVGGLFPFQNAHGSDPTTDTELLKLKRAVVANYAAVTSASYQDSLAAANTLRTAVDKFLAEPSERCLRGAREAWVAARVPYSQTEVCRFYDGPIDQAEGMINAWPIDENYIDYVADNSQAGVINAASKFPVLSRELILSLNEKEGKKNISTGFHAIEFLLWGQDLSATGPGNRSWRDYAEGSTNADRRRAYLRIITELLVEHLETVAAAWNDGNKGNYRSDFIGLDPDAALANILKGMGALSGPELAGERLTVPYETKEQEDEQSCFSDNTRSDLIYDAVGIENVYRGRYLAREGRKVEGPGIHDLLLRVDPAFAGTLAAQIEKSVACARSIPQPFDQAILGTSPSPGREAVKKAATALQAQSELIAQAAKVLSIKLNL